MTYHISALLRDFQAHAYQLLLIINPHTEKPFALMPVNLLDPGFHPGQDPGSNFQISFLDNSIGHSNLILPVGQPNQKLLLFRTDRAEAAAGSEKPCKFRHLPGLFSSVSHTTSLPAPLSTGTFGKYIVTLHGAFPLVTRHSTDVAAVTYIHSLS